MKKFSLLLPSLLAGFVFPGAIALGDELETLRDVLALYREEARRNFGGEGVLYEIVESGESNAYAELVNGKPTLSFTTARLREYDGDQLLNTICHELGHFLGDVSIAEDGTGLTVEGEADYFAGACMFRYFTEVRRYSESDALEALDTAAKEARSTSRGMRLDPDDARSERAPRGTIEQGHPEAACRVLTTMNGARGLPRPACWYNP